MFQLENPRCFICGEKILTSIGWVALFTNEQKQSMCQRCEERFEELFGDTCVVCNRQLATIEDQFRHGDRCYDCVRWEADPTWAQVLQRNHSLFLYNEFATEVIARFKFRGDHAICFAFTEKLTEKFRELPHDIIVPIPLSEERLYERSFNQAEALIEATGHRYERVLSRIHTEKQSKKSRHERLHQTAIFTLTNAAAIKGKRVLIVDDIYTTGTTIRQAAKLLKTAGAQSVISVTIARG